MTDNTISDRLFLLDTDNQSFVDDGAGRPSREGIWVASAIALSVMVFFTVMVLSNITEPDDQTYGLLCLGAMWFFLGIGVFRYARDRLALQRDGRLIYGTLTDASSYIDSEQNQFYLRVRYQVTSPETGATITGGGEEVRDLRDLPLPTAGTPVALLYLSDDNYRLL